MLTHSCKPGDQLHHKILGIVTVTENTEKLNESRAADSYFVDHDGEIKEVSISLLSHMSYNIPQEIVNEVEYEREVREEMQREGLL